MPEPDRPDRHLATKNEERNANKMNDLHDIKPEMNPSALVGQMIPSAEIEQPPGLTATPTPLALLQAFRRRWILAVTLGVLLGGMGAAILWIMTPPVIRARTTLHVAMVQPVVVFNAREPGADFTSYQRSQVAMIKSRLVLNRVLKDHEVANLSLIKAHAEPTEWLEKNLQVDFALAPDILSIALFGDKAEEMKIIVNAVREAYLQEIVNKEKTARLRKLDKLKDLWSQYEDYQREKVKRLKQLEEDLRAGNPKTVELRYKFELNELEVTRKQLMDYQWQIKQAELRLIDPAKALILAISPEALEKSIAKDPEVLGLQGEIDFLTAKMENYKNSFKDERRYKEVEVDLNSTQKKLADKRAELRGRAEQSERAKASQNANFNVEAQNKQLEFLKNVEQVLKKDVEKRLIGIEKFSKEAVDHEWLKAELAYDKEISTTIGKQKEMLLVELDAPDRVTELEKAHAVLVQDKKSQMKTAGLAAFGLFGLAVLGVSLLEFRTRRVSGVNDIVQGLGMRLVGAIPMLPSRKPRLLSGTTADAQYWKHLLNESIDATRTLLVHSARVGTLKTIMVTSASPGEGKTLVSGHLAASLARAGFRCLLIDADLRKPSLHKIFNQPLGPGISELILGQAATKDVIRAGPVDGLSFIPAGQWSPMVLSNLSQQGLAGIVEELKAQFDFIVIDSAPVLAVADSLTIGQHVDGVIFSVLRDVSRLPAIFTAYERLIRLNIRILGAVVGGAPLDSYGSTYKYYSSPEAEAPASVPSTPAK
ncbi:MAG: polysaccharide biosynthesis tyrosine autokinase [Planctomycetes bacterium]|nr:polysaccharide biosynthesis tyrosine autokinase [Planctomycetota bacterium]